LTTLTIERRPGEVGFVFIKGMINSPPLQS
jgi:hypothetical protein